MSTNFMISAEATVKYIHTTNFEKDGYICLVIDDLNGSSFENYLFEEALTQLGLKFASDEYEMFSNGDWILSGSWTLEISRTEAEQIGIV